MSADAIEPSSPEMSPFLMQLENVENVLHRMENYTRRLNHQINDLKCVTESNRQVIARLQTNGKSMKSLLDDEQEQLKTQASQLVVVESMHSGMSLDMLELEKDLSSMELDLKQACNNPKKEKNNHLCETCKVTNISQISWTQCKPTTDESVTEKVENPHHLVEMHRETVALLNSLKRDLDKKNACQDYQRKRTISNLNRQQKLIQRVQCIVKTVDNLNLETTSVMEVKTICRRVMSALVKRQKVYQLSPEASRIGWSSNTSCSDMKVTKSRYSFHKNPYL